MAVFPLRRRDALAVVHPLWRLAWAAVRRTPGAAPPAGSTVFAAAVVAAAAKGYGWEALVSVVVALGAASVFLLGRWSCEPELRRLRREINRRDEERHGTNRFLIELSALIARMGQTNAVLAATPDRRNGGPR